jgi:hypothetical protein
MPDAGRTHGPPAEKSAGGRYHRQGRSNRHSPRNGLRLISRSPRCPGFDSHRRRQISACRRPKGRHRQFANLIPASGDQDHTPSPSASTLLVRQSQNVHRIPLPTSVTIAIRPSCGGGTAGNIHLICVSEKAKYFSIARLTRFLNRCLSGKSVVRLDALIVAEDTGTSGRKRLD